MVNIVISRNETSMNRTQLIYALAYYMSPGAYQTILTYSTETLQILLASYQQEYE